MSLPEIRFQDIRPQDSSRNAGFEELCCQLASLEPRPSNAEFFRKGRGGDAGVECFLRRADQSETGWQAKYVDGWDASLKNQLDASIRTALEKHPKLNEYVVCLPFDLSDARSGKSQSALAQWERWKAAWIATAKGEGRQLTIQLWQKSAIIERLTRDDSAYSGMILYWFDQQTLSPQWFRTNFEHSRAALGSRYVPEFNIELPIRGNFLAFVRDSSILDEVERWSLDLREKAYSAILSVERAHGTTTENYSEELRRTTNTLIAQIDSAAIPLDRPFPVELWRTAAEAAQVASRTALKCIRPAKAALRC